MLVDLRDERFDRSSDHRAIQAIRNAGFTIEDTASGAALASIDQEFGGAWSSEAYAGHNIIARRDGQFAGFVSYAPRGLRYAWLSSWQGRADVGIFGPFGVVQRFRGTPLGRALLQAALAKLRALNYEQALIPAVHEGRLAEYYRRECGAHVAEEFEMRRWTGGQIPTTVLASGNGTNFQAALDAARNRKIPLQINALIANKRSAYVLQRAKGADVPTVASVIWDRAVESRETYDERLLHAIRQTQPKLVLLLGWMHILSERFITEFPETINIHPAFLPLDQTSTTVELPDGTTIPAFRGAHAVRDALVAGSEWFGASVHRVIVQSDRGPILTRRPVAVRGAKTEGEVMEKVRPLEHESLLSGIMRWVFERPGAAE
ncbi:MAG: GNAT family N-acetyltransferase [Candidatus Eremiobacteraeota bacterium]|nr:GNAT family N-acetyltransferase [Candidatus Eremiobacteraeota bacterium]